MRVHDAFPNPREALRIAGVALVSALSVAAFTAEASAQGPVAPSNSGRVECTTYTAHADNKDGLVINGGCTNGHFGGLRCYDPITGMGGVYDWNYRNEDRDVRFIGFTSRIPKIAACFDKQNNVVLLGTSAKLALAA